METVNLRENVLQPSNDIIEKVWEDNFRNDHIDAKYEQSSIRRAYHWITSNNAPYYRGITDYRSFTISVS
ncbi:MAG TPA: hypothetical protein VFR94_11065 [Nitrososphaeraceae archaeon]|nr:hypothetical protein [Nitrososphaeraceae archaeon]